MVVVVVVVVLMVVCLHPPHDRHGIHKRPPGKCL
jgi:hypothetical protein